jgi:phosphate transport system substrate-binding protein
MSFFHGSISMRTVERKWFLITAIIGLLLAVAPAMVQGQQLSFAGATTMKPLVEEASKDFGKQNPNVKFVVGIGGSARGVELAGKGEIQIGMSCRDPNAKEKGAYADLKVYKIGIDANGMIVHGSNSVQKITAEQIRKIYTGKITNWKELGGNDAPIVLISVMPKHSSFEVFLDYFKLEGKWEANVAYFKEKGAAEFSTLGVPTVEATSDLTAAMITKPNGMGFCSVGAALALATKGAPLKLLDLDGVAATEENVVNNSYPLPRPLLLLTKGEPSGPAKDFIDYMMGVSGRTLLKSKGFFVPK